MKEAPLCPHGKDPKRNDFVGGVVTQVAERALLRGASIEQEIGAFVNEFAGAAYKEGMKKALTPSVN
jgi:hypothetical protein